MPIVQRKTVLTVYAAFALYFSGLYFIHYPVPGFGTRLRETAAALFFLWLAAAFGRRLLLALRKGLPRLNVPEESADDLLWSAAAGAAALSLAILALGAAGGLRPSFLFFLTAIAALACGRDLRHWLMRAAERARSAAGAAVSSSTAALAGLAGALIAVAFLCALAPPTYYDSLVYHLALPAKYLQEGRVGFVPYNHYSHFPQNMEMLYAWFLALGDDVAAHLFTLLLGALTAASLWRMGRLFFPSGSGRTTPGEARPSEAGRRWGLLIFMAAPCALLLSTETYVEAPLAFWTTLALEAALRARRAEDASPARGWWLLAGLCGGFAAGIKYTGALTPALLTALALAWPDNRPWRRRAGEAACVALPAFLLFLPWMVKNFVLTGGNPVFPFLVRWFPASRVYLYEEAARAYFQVMDEYKGSSNLIWELFQLPWRLMARPLSFGGGYDVTGDLGWALPMLLFPLFLFYGLKRSAGRFLFVYVAAHGLLWASLRPVLRFLFPLFPVICLLAGTGAAAFMESIPRWARAATRVMTALFLLSHGVLFYLVQRVRDPFPAAWGLETREEYLRRKLDPYAALEFINGRLPPGSRVLFVGELRGYYCERPYVAPMAHLPQPLREWAEEAGDGPALRGKLLESGFTHVFFNRREADRLKGYRVLDLTELGQKAWTEMLGALPALYDEGGKAVFTLRSPSDHG